MKKLLSKEMDKMSCECEVSTEEIIVLKFLFDTVLKSGKTPTTDEFCSYLGKDREEITRIIDELERKDMIRRKRGTQKIINVYPLSLIPTEHRIILENGRELFAMCAADALGMPVMFNRDVTIISKCKHCKQEIVIDVKNAEIVRMSQPDISICSPPCQVAPAAETTCPDVNFFCSTDHAQRWIEENEKKRGNITRRSVRQAFPKIKECWKSYGKTLAYS